MSYVNGTPHYNLPQTVGTDKRDWFDTNEAFAEIDAAIHTANQTAGSAASQVTTLKGRVDNIDTTIEGIQHNIVEAQGDINGLNIRVGALDNKVDDNYTDLTDSICSIKEASATAQYFHHRSSFFWYNDTLYVATDDINIGDQIVPNVNCRTTTVTSEIYRGIAEVQTTASMTYQDAIYALAQQVDFDKISANTILINELSADTFGILRVGDHSPSGIDFGSVQYHSEVSSMRFSKVRTQCEYVSMTFNVGGTITYSTYTDVLVGANHRLILLY